MNDNESIETGAEPPAPVDNEVVIEQEEAGGSPPRRHVVIDSSDEELDEYPGFIWNCGLPYSDHNYCVPYKSKPLDAPTEPFPTTPFLIERVIPTESAPSNSNETNEEEPTPPAPAPEIPQPKKQHINQIHYRQPINHEHVDNRVTNQPHRPGNAQFRRDPNSQGIGSGYQQIRMTPTSSQRGFSQNPGQPIMRVQQPFQQKLTSIAGPRPLNTFQKTVRPVPSPMRTAGQMVSSAVDNSPYVRKDMSARADGTNQQYFINKGGRPQHMVHDPQHMQGSAPMLVGSGQSKLIRSKPIAPAQRFVRDDYKDGDRLSLSPKKPYIDSNNRSDYDDLQTHPHQQSNVSHTIRQHVSPQKPTVQAKPPHRMTEQERKQHLQNLNQQGDRPKLPEGYITPVATPTPQPAQLSQSSSSMPPDDILEPKEEPKPEVKPVVTPFQKKEHNYPPEVSLIAAELRQSAEALHTDEDHPTWKTKEMSSDQIQETIRVVTQELEEEKRSQTGSPERRRHSHQSRMDQFQTVDPYQKSIYHHQPSSEPRQYPPHQHQQHHQHQQTPLVHQQHSIPQRPLHQQHMFGQPQMTSTPQSMPHTLQKPNHPMSLPLTTQPLSRPRGRPKGATTKSRVQLGTDTDGTPTGGVRLSLPLRQSGHAANSGARAAQNASYNDYNGSRSSRHPPVPKASDSESEREEEEEEEYGDDWTMRCYCELTHSTGFTIECEKCKEWQHGHCMGLREEDKNEGYNCERCRPRRMKISKQEAQKIQRREIEKTRRIEEQNARFLKSQKGRKSARKERDSPAPRISLTAPNIKRRAQETDNNEYSKKAHRILTSMESTTGAEVLLHDIKKIDKAKKLLVLEDVFGLVTTQDLEAKAVVFELYGNICLPEEIGRDREGNSIPHVFLYDGLNKGSCGEDVTKEFSQQLICVDARKKQTDAKFVRRSCNPNCVLKHVLFNGVLGIMIVTTKPLLYNTEITIPFDADCRKSRIAVPCSEHYGDRIIECPYEIDREKYIAQHPELNSSALESVGRRRNSMNEARALREARMSLEKVLPVVIEPSIKQRATRPSTSSMSTIDTEEESERRKSSRTSKRLPVPEPVVEPVVEEEEKPDVRRNVEEEVEDKPVLEERRKSTRVSTRESLNEQNSVKEEEEKPDIRDKKVKKTDSDEENKKKKSKKEEAEADNEVKEEEEKVVVRDKKKEKNVKEKTPVKEIVEPTIYVLPSDRNKMSREDRKAQQIAELIAKEEKKKRKSEDAKPSSVSRAKPATKKTSESENRARTSVKKVDEKKNDFKTPSRASARSETTIPTTSSRNRRKRISENEESENQVSTSSAKPRRKRGHEENGHDNGITPQMLKQKYLMDKKSDEPSRKVKKNEVVISFAELEKKVLETVRQAARKSSEGTEFSMDFGSIKPSHSRKRIASESESKSPTKETPKSRWNNEPSTRNEAPPPVATRNSSEQSTTSHVSTPPTKKEPRKLSMAEYNTKRSSRRTVTAADIAASNAISPAKSWFDIAASSSTKCEDEIKPFNPSQKTPEKSKVETLKEEVRSSPRTRSSASKSLDTVATLPQPPPPPPIAPTISTDIDEEEEEAKVKKAHSMSLEERLRTDFGMSVGGK